MSQSDPDARIRFSQLFEELDLRDCRSVIMGVCESGLARTGVNSEYIGLPSAMLSSGARYVIGALWQILQLATAVIMTRFLADLKDPDASVGRRPRKQTLGKSPISGIKYAAVMNSKNRRDADDALTAFRLAVQTSPDLISDDADALVKNVTSRVEKAFSQAQGGIAGALQGKLSSKPVKMPASLAEVGLYEDR